MDKPVLPVDPKAKPVAELAHKLAPALGGVEAAIRFMQAHPGCWIEIPSLAAINASK
jgi:hypothetical protein